MIIPGWEIVQNFIRRQIGVRTDTASSTGSVHAKLNYLAPNLIDAQGTIASNDLKTSADTERSTTSTSYVKAKSINVARCGSIRVSYDQRSTTSASSNNGEIYINGVDTGKGNTSTSGSYSTYTFDFAVKPGDTVELWHRGSASFASYVRNFRIYYTSGVAVPVVITD